MPGSKEVLHPILENCKITFTEDDHSYIDNIGKKYVSVTTLVANAFPKFDSDLQAEKYAKKNGLEKQDVLDAWNKKGKEATTSGTRLHENIEYFINGELDKMHNPNSLIEKIRFDNGIQIIKNIEEKYKPEWMKPELLVFSPSFGIAGSIDLLVKINDKSYIIFDWKCLSKDIVKEGWNGQCGNIPPTFKIQDSNYWHYGLQLQIYENILKSENYIDPMSKVVRCLLIWNGQKFNTEKLPDLPEAWGVMLWKDKLATQNKYIKV